MTSSPAPVPSQILDAITLAAVPALLPQAPPFRLVDRVVSADLAAGKLVAELRITAGSALWPAESATRAATCEVVSWFPDVLVIEALCQAAACLNILEAAPDAARRHLGYLVAVSQFRFPEFTAPHLGRAHIGDTLSLQVERKSRLGALVCFAATAHVLGELEITAKKEPREIASGQLLFAIA